VSGNFHQVRSNSFTSRQLLGSARLRLWHFIHTDVTIIMLWVGWLGKDSSISSTQHDVFMPPRFSILETHKNKNAIIWKRVKHKTEKEKAQLRKNVPSRIKKFCSSAKEMWTLKNDQITQKGVSYNALGSPTPFKNRHGSDCNRVPPNVPWRRSAMAVVVMTWAFK
jgi:hypothetical protein